MIGGGLIGVEVAEILKHARAARDVRDPRDAGTSRSRSSAREGRARRRAHARARGRRPAGARGGGDPARRRTARVRGVRARRATEIPCDVVVSAIGVVPNTGFLAGCGLDALGERRHRGRRRRCARALPGVWAAGDCANVTWIDGSRRPEQLWYTARDQGRVAAASMAGDAAAYRRGTWYNSAKFFDLEYTTAGWVPVSLDCGRHAGRAGARRALPGSSARPGGSRARAHRLPRASAWSASTCSARRWNHEPLPRVDRRAAAARLGARAPARGAVRRGVERLFRVLPKPGVLMQAGLLDTYQHPVQSRQWPAWVALRRARSRRTWSCTSRTCCERRRRARSSASAASGRSTALVYSLAMIVGGAYFLRRHGNSRYQRIRTAQRRLRPGA